MDNNNKTNIALKIIDGVMITDAEFKLALKYGFYENMTYNQLKASHYETPNRQAWICNHHISSKIDDNNSFCCWGIHYAEMLPEYTTVENLQYLKDSGIIK